MAPPRTVLARLAVLAVTAGALVGLLRGFRRGDWVRFVQGGAWGLATRGAAAAALGLLSVSLVSNVVGNATLAERLTRATLSSATVAALLLGAQTVLASAAAALLHVPALQRRRLVARHRDLLQRRAAWLLRAGSMALWAWATARLFGVTGSVADGAAAVFGLRLKVGELDVALGDLAAFAVTLAAAIGLARLVRFVLDEAVFTGVDLPRGVPIAISKTAQYALVALGFSWAVLASGMEVSRFGFLVGTLGVGIGFGLQNVVNNFVSGLILLYERPVQAGDIVEVGAVSGEVTRIGVRSSTVRTFAGAEVIVPNATFISAEVTNWTLSDRQRRIELPVGVAYGTPPQQAIDLLLGVVREHEGVLAAPAPTALFIRFGDSSLEFALRFWTADFERWQSLASEVLLDVHAALARAGIEIPFPQRDLHLRSVDPAAAKALAEAQGKRRDG
jgi:small-conductance mechanosensitive channel